MAAMVFDRSLEDEPELLDAVAAAAGIALENGRLRAELRARLQELKGSRIRVLEAGRQERQRLERNLHDGAQQRLVALSLELSLLGQSAGADPVLRDRLARAKSEVSASLEELRMWPGGSIRLCCPAMVWRLHWNHWRLEPRPGALGGRSR